MGLEYQGELSIGAICPLAAGAIAPIEVEVNAQVVGLTALSASITLNPPTIIAAAAIAASMATAITAMISAGITFPPPTLQLSAIAARIASLNLILAACGDLVSLFATGGVFAWTYEGPGNALGPAVAASLATAWPDGTPANENSFAVILGAGADVGVKTALLSFFGGLSV